MKKIMALLALFAPLVACEVPVNPDGMDAQTDASVQAEAGEASADVLAPHVDGGGMDSLVD